MNAAIRAVRRGFTLIEVLVATVIMVVIILAVVTIATDTFKAYDRAVSDLSTQSEARGVLDAMENDFRNSTDSRSHDWALTSHRFKVYDAERFVDRWTDEDFGCGQKFGQLVMSEHRWEPPGVGAT